VLSLPILEGLLAAVAGVHSLLAWGPLAGANLTMLLVVLECLDEAEDLADITADREIVELAVSEDSLAVDDEGGAEVKGVVGGEAAVVAAELLGQVSEHGDLHAAEATLLTGLVGELLVSEVRVNGGSDDLAVCRMNYTIGTYCSL